MLLPEYQRTEIENCLVFFPKLSNYVEQFTLLYSLIPSGRKGRVSVEASFQKRAKMGQSNE